MIEGIRSGGANRAESTSSVAKAAGDFEALLVTQMLRYARSGDGGWLGSGEDTASSPVLEMAEESLAQALSAQGGLGLATMVRKGLGAASERGAAEKPPAAPGPVPGG